MLLRYIVSNFKSIGHPVEFSMFPTEESTDERFLKTITTKAGEWKVLRRGGFFGPNASGKSSFIESIDFARDYIVDGQKSGKGTGVNQFRGDFEDLEGISSFQFMFYLEGEVYEYGFSLCVHRQPCVPCREYLAGMPLGYCYAVTAVYRDDDCCLGCYVAALAVQCRCVAFLL